MDKTKVTKDVENKTLTIERTFDAPKEKLWRAYADKEWFEKWWGPEGWQTTTKAFDFRPGGQIHYGMKCVDENQGEWFGQESWGLMQIESVDEPTSFAAKDHFSDADGTLNTEMPTQRFEVELVEEADGKTRLVSRSITETVEQLEQLVKMGMVEGFSSQLNRLEDLLVE
ncbi:MAG TPA: SRPBCC domain-containing protein [Candidatus Saccharimonadales bacterium]